MSAVWDGGLADGRGIENRVGRVIPTRDRASSDSTDGAEVTPVISEWVAACFPQACMFSESGFKELIREAADEARNDLDASSAVAWGDSYTFPSSYVTDDTACLAEAGFFLKIW